MEQVRAARRWYLSLILLSKESAQLCLACLSVVPHVFSGLCLW